MGLELELCQALIIEGNLTTLGKYRIKRDYFRTEQPLFDFILRHHERHGVMPSEEAIRRGVNKPEYVQLDPGQPLSYWCQEIINREQRAVVNKAMEAGAKMLGEDVFDVEAWTKTMNKALTKISGDMGESTDLVLDSAERVPIVIDRYRKRTEDNGVEGVVLPWEHLTNETGGMLGGDVSVISADTGVGKTWVLLLIGYHAWLSGLKVMCVSKEMAGEVIEDRFHAIRSAIAYKAFRQGKLDEMTFEKWQKDAEELGEQDAKRFIVVDDVESSKSGMLEIAAKIEEYKPDLLLIDGVYLLSDDSGDDLDWKSVGRVIISLKRVLKKYKIPGVVTTQNKDLSNRTRGGKNAAQAANSTNALAYSKEISRIASLLMILFQGEADREAGQMRLFLPKVREGERLNLTLNWNFDTMDFSMKSFNKEASGTEAPVEPIDWDNDKV